VLLLTLCSFDYKLEFFFISNTISILKAFFLILANLLVIKNSNRFLKFKVVKD